MTATTVWVETLIASMLIPILQRFLEAVLKLGKLLRVPRMRFFVVK